jgi:hypothetical protein
MMVGKKASQVGSKMAAANNGIETLLNEFDMARITALSVACGSLPAPNFRPVGWR